MKYEVYSRFNLEQAILKAFEAIKLGDPELALGIITEKGSNIESQYQVDRALEFAENGYKLNYTTKNTNTFKPGDEVIIDALSGCIVGIVESYDSTQDVYMVEINGQILPVDHHVGNMRLGNFA